MRMLGRITAAALLLALFTLPMYAVDPTESRTPLMRTVEPFKAKPGDQVVVMGDDGVEGDPSLVNPNDGGTDLPTLIRCA